MHYKYTSKGSKTIKERDVAILGSRKKNYFFNGSAIKGLSPPLELNGSRNFFQHVNKFK